ncbi:transposase family protein [Streptomyces sp. NPDC127051]|uniref:transposase family protein n=1 Tax=Streptomyces sp. NPDC127051 TaxID=3347119 RepID=UPI00365361B7
MQYKDEAVPCQRPRSAPRGRPVICPAGGLVAGRPPVRTVAAYGGGWILPRSTAHNIITARALPTGTDQYIAWFHHTDDVVLDAIAVRGELVTVQAAARSGRAPCPGCGTSSTRVHSRYVRRLDDTATGQRRVVIELQVRRFRCRQQDCSQAAFVQQVPGLTFRYGRRSQGLHTALRHVALMLAGRAGARLADVLPSR